MPFLAYYPSIYKQDDLTEAATFISKDGKVAEAFLAGPPPKYETLEKRANYDTESPAFFTGPMKSIRLGDIALARSGDKGSNLNFGLFVQTEKQWEWLRTFMTRDKMRELLNEDFHNEFFIERVEFPNIHAVHFVIYGILGRGVSSSSRLDGFGKGFADFIRDVVIEVPERIL